jgi:hypothetical protein
VRRSDPSSNDTGRALGHGECEGVASWIERRVGRAWGAGLFALREIELEGQDDPVLRPQDSSLAPDARELLVDLRLLLLNESAIALRANSPATLWGRMLHKWPSEADLAFVRLARRLDSSLKRLDPDDDVPPFDDLFRLPCTLVRSTFGDWSDPREAIDGSVSAGSASRPWTGRHGRVRGRPWRLGGQQGRDESGS